MFITVYQQNPMIIFRKRGLIQYPNFEKFRKLLKNAWVYAWKHENKHKRRGIKVLPALWEKNLAKIWEKNDKKPLVEPCQVGERERKVWKSFEKVFESVKILFKKKLESRCSIDRKTGSINQTKQRLTEFLKKDFD